MEFVKRMLRTEKGFSLIEVMIALVLFAVGLLAFAGLEIVAVRNATYSKDYGKANTYAQQKVEEVKGTAWDFGVCWIRYVGRKVHPDVDGDDDRRHQEGSCDRSVG